MQAQHDFQILADQVHGFALGPHFGIVGVYPGGIGACVAGFPFFGDAQTDELFISGCYSLQ
jgi:hypothetical protein